MFQEAHYFFLEMLPGKQTNTDSGADVRAWEPAWGPRSPLGLALSQHPPLIPPNQAHCCLCSCSGKPGAALGRAAALLVIISYFFSLWVCLLRTVFVNGIIQCGLLWLLSLSLMFSSFIHVACICTSFILGLNNIPNIAFCLSIHQLMDIWVLAVLWIYHYELSCTDFFCECTSSFLLQIPRSGISGS